jgi:hypothetical protein
LNREAKEIKGRIELGVKALGERNPIQRYSGFTFAALAVQGLTEH